MRVAIIGAGLAGTALAYVLKQNGAEPVIYEASDSIASGASGNAVGLYNPRFTAEKGPEQEFYAAAFFKALAAFQSLSDIDWNPCGALHLVTDETKARRFPKTVENWGWPETDMRMVSSKEASDIAGIEILKDCLHLPRSGTVSPAKLCAAYAKGIEVHLNTEIQDLSLIEADAVVIACGMGCKNFIPLDISAVRGQVTYVKQTEISKNLRCTLGYSGYIAPAIRGEHCIGSTFQRWLDHTDIIPQDDHDNLEKVFLNVPALKDDYTVTAQRVGIRVTTKDHMPMIGRVSENLYVSTAHGSHGILSGLMGAEVLAAMILKNRDILSDTAVKVLNPVRF